MFWAFGVSRPRRTKSTGPEPYLRNSPQRPAVAKLEARTVLQGHLERALKRPPNDDPWTESHRRSRLPRCPRSPEWGSLWRGRPPTAHTSRNLDLRLHRLLGHDSHEKDVLGRRHGRLVGLLLVREDGIEVVIVRACLSLSCPCLFSCPCPAGWLPPLAKCLGHS